MFDSSIVCHGAGCRWRSQLGYYVYGVRRILHSVHFCLLFNRHSALLEHLLPLLLTCAIPTDRPLQRPYERQIDFEP
jgi:hypothetical protein